jgi:hypothetical protein
MLDLYLAKNKVEEALREAELYHLRQIGKRSRKIKNRQRLTRLVVRVRSFLAFGYMIKALL